MNPMYDAEELARSLRWAVASASADPSPNMGIAIIPRYARAAHTSVLGARGRHDVMMGTPGVHALTTLEKGFRFLPQDAWKGGARLYHRYEVHGGHCPHIQRGRQAGSRLWTDPGRPPGALARRELWDKGGVSVSPALAAGQGPRWAPGRRLDAPS